jgi:hypothetical protein
MSSTVVGSLEAKRGRAASRREFLAASAGGLAAWTANQIKDWPDGDLYGKYSL